MSSLPTNIGPGEPFVSRHAGPLPQDARVVIVGGGIAGCSVAYHLAKKGWRDVLVLEQGAVGGGTTWHAAGMVGRMRLSSAMTRINEVSAALYKGLKEETGHDPCWKQVGSLVLCRTGNHEQRMFQYRRAAGLSSYFGVEIHELSPNEALEKNEFIEISDISAALWIPHDGTVNPLQCAVAVAKGAELHGARVCQGVQVNDLIHENRRVKGVRTAQGDISADVVVICGGMWSRQIALRAGVNIPLWPVEHHYLISNSTGRDVSHLPTSRDFDGALYFRGTADRIMLGAFQNDSKPRESDKVGADFRFRLFDPDWEHFQDPLAEGLHRLPILKKIGFDKFVNGPESFTPDNNFILGESPEMDGLFISAGFNSAGIACSGGAGWALAEWIESGEQPFDLWSVDIRRFSPAFNNRAFLRERVSETLGFHYRMAWPNLEFESGRNVRRSPLHDRMVAAGACFQQKMLLERPSWFAMPGQTPVTEYAFGRQNWFENHRAEHMGCRENVAIFDQTSFSKFIMRGPDALTVLQRVCGNNVDVPVGRIVYTGMFNARGTFESDCSVVRVAHDEFYIVTGTAQSVRDAHWIRRKTRSGERAELVDVTAGWCVIGLMGPRSRALLQSLTQTSLTNENFKFGTTQMIEAGKATCRAARITYVGELGWELHVLADQATLLYDTLWEAGQSFRLVNAGHYAINSLRLEKGYRAFGAELSPDDTPLEAGLDFVVSFKKDCEFIGRDALLRQKEAGLRKRLMSFVLKDPEPMLWGSERIFRDSQCVGYLSSGFYGHAVGGGIGLGYVKNGGQTVGDDYLLSGTYEIDAGGTRYPAVAILECPYDPGRKRIMA